MAGRTAKDRAEREARQRARSYAIRQQVFAERGRRRRRDDVIALIVFVVVIALATTAQVGFFTAGPGKPVAAASPAVSTTPTPTASSDYTLPNKSLSENKTWKLSMTIDGAKLALQLDGKKAPQAVANFLALVDKGYYSGSYCPRLTTKALYVLQCGTHTDSTSDPGPGYTFGPLENVPKSGVYTTGVLAMARGEAEDSQGAQFFIVYRDTQLPAPGYTVFGKVTSGLSALKSAVVSKGVTAAGTAAGDGAPAATVQITDASIDG